MRRTFLIFTFLLVFATAQQLYNTSQYTLGNNLIINSQFHQPALPNDTALFLNYPTSLPGWSCINQCEVKNLTNICNYLHLNCSKITIDKVVDLDSSCSFDNVSQTVTIQKEGDYLLTLMWIPPTAGGLNKNFVLQINGTVILSIRITTRQLIMNKNQTVIHLPPGKTVINLRMNSTWCDYQGANISQLRLQELIQIKQNQFLDNLQNFYLFNSATQILNQIPGNRIYLNYLTQFLTIFDRLHLYYYHQRNNTYYAYTFLKKMNQFALNRSSLPQIVMYLCNQSSYVCNNINNGYTYLYNELNQKYLYSSSAFLEKNSNGVGFFANYLDFFYYSVPCSLFIALVLYVLFYLLFNYKISIFLRKYSFLALILFIFFQGNFQDFGFHLTVELKYLFSLGFTHKIANILLLILFYTLLVLSIGGLLICKFHYKKLAKYLFEYYRNKIGCILFESCQRMVFPLFLGIAHAFTYQNVKYQAVVLGSIELVYLFLKIMSLTRAIVKQKTKLSFSIVASMLRIILILTFYLFDCYAHPIINLIHKFLFISYLVLWVVQLVLQLIRFLLQGYKIIAQFSARKQKITNKNQLKNIPSISGQNSVQKKVVFAQEIVETITDQQQAKMQKVKEFAHKKNQRSILKKYISKEIQKVEQIKAKTNPIHKESFN